MLFHSFQIEARALLHWRIVDCSLTEFCHYLLHEDAKGRYVLK